MTTVIFSSCRFKVSCSLFTNKKEKASMEKEVKKKEVEKMASFAAACLLSNILCLRRNAVSHLHSQNVEFYKSFLIGIF